MNSELLRKILPSLKDLVVVIDETTSDMLSYRYWYEDGEDNIKSNTATINFDRLMQRAIDYITDWEQAQGICSHKNFYLQTDGREWFCGYAYIHTTYDDKARFEDLSKGKTMHEAVFEFAEKVRIKNIARDKGNSEYTKAYPSGKILEPMFKSPDTVRRKWKKIGRNSPCPCRSGKKFKNCCVNHDRDWSIDGENNEMV